MNSPAGDAEQPKRTRGPRKAMRIALEAAKAAGFKEGWAACESDLKQPMLGTLAALLLWGGIAFALGAWLF